jgi:hypothetical protein
MCTCAPGFIRVGKDCINIGNKICGTNQVYSTALQKCVCSQGYYDTNGQLNCNQCVSGSYPNSDGFSCVCSDGSQFWDVNSNLCQNRCGMNQEWINGQCQCIQSTYWFNQVCIQCPYNSLSSVDRSTCVCNSPTAYYLPSNNCCVECSMSNYEVLNQEKSGCDCQSGYIRNSSSNKCVQNIQQCKVNEILNATTNKCNCLVGFTKDSSGICRPQCGVL